MRTIFFHNIMSPYKTLLFNEINRLWSGEFMVCYFARTSILREWRIEEEKMQYPHIVLEENCRWEETSALLLSWRVLITCVREKPACIFLGEYSTIPYWIAWIYGLVTNKKMVAVVESQGQDHVRAGVKESLKAFLKRLFLTKCSHVIVAGEKHRTYVADYGVPMEKITVMGGVGGVDQGIYEPYRMQYSRWKKRKEIALILKLPDLQYFLYVGRFSEEKNLPAVLSAFSTSGADKKGWGLLLVGSGPHEEALRSMVEEYELENVFFPGFIQQDQLPLYYLVSSVFVLPSLSEPWGLVVDEALALGLPVIASERCGCVPDLVRDGENGRVFSPEDKEELTQIFRDMMESAQLEDMGEVSLQIAKEYSPEESARRIANSVLGC